MKPVKSKATLGNFASRVDHCQACGIKDGAAVLHIHHIIKRGRSDEACNLIRLCGWRWDGVRPCHDRAEGHGTKDWLTLAIVLSLKKLRDPESWDPERLKVLFLKNLPDLEPIPQQLLDSYRRWHPENRHG